MLSRRQLFSLVPAGLIAPGLLLPRRLAALDGGTDRKFLFIYAYGGWDPLLTFVPKLDAPFIDTQEGCEVAEANGITFVDHEERPSVRTFFENYGDRAALINGMEVRSVTHERCQRILFTGGGDSTADDWGVLAASNTLNYYATPHLIFSGPAFTAKYAANVVRAGEAGQLTELIDASALEKSTLPIIPPSDWGDAMEDALVRERARAFAAASGRGTPSNMGAYYTSAMENLASLQSAGDRVNLDPDQSGCRRDIAKDAACAFNAFEIGLARCAITKDMGWCSMSWDTHAGNNLYQTRSFEELFGYINELMEDLDGRTGASGNPLRDEVTIVVMSEMGRYPQMGGDGRAHWAFTSALVIGSGVKGGQVVGELDDNYEGQAVDVNSGATDDSGDKLVPGHLGATLLELAGLDYREYTTSGQPIKAILDT